MDVRLLDCQAIGRLAKAMMQRYFITSTLDEGNRSRDDDNGHVDRRKPQPALV